MFPLPGNCPKYLNSPISFFFFLRSGKDGAKTASSLRLFWKTTTQLSRTPSMRAGIWLSHARAVRGRPPRPSSIRGRPTSWSVYPGGTCWVRGDRLMFFLSLSPCSLSAGGLNIPITSAQGAAEDWNHWGRTVDEPAPEEPLQEKASAPGKINFYSQVPIHFLPHFVDLSYNSLYWILCKHWLSNLLVISNSERFSIRKDFFSLIKSGGSWRTEELSYIDMNENLWLASSATKNVYKRNEYNEARHGSYLWIFLWLQHLSLSWHAILPLGGNFGEF